MTRSAGSINDADRVEELFAAASELPAAEREAFVARECGAEVALREKVLALLRADQQAGSFLARPTIDPNEGMTSTIEEAHAALTGPRAEGIGSIIGRYQLVRVLGQGTFGTVFLAEQFEGVLRQVALKCLNPGMNSEEVLARFKIDRQALAAMDHPNVVKVFDGGQTPNGYPYFVMELVDGAVTLTDYCNNNHLDVSQRLELFVQACQGVQHAHTKGIIHRDLKPSNILVTVKDRVPIVKVIDFGIAKAVGDPLSVSPQFTTINSIIGTLEYMSPEQAGLNALDIDARTDIYALGAVLYELLTGASPLAEWLTPAAALEAILKTIRERIPPTPSTRRSAIRGKRGAAAPASRAASLTSLKKGDLDWIVMKALEKERARRFGTAMEFARDVRNYLDGKVVEARPPTATYLLGKFLRNHRGPVAAVLVIMLALVAGIIGTSWGLARAEQFQKQEARQRRIAEQNAGQALDSARMAELSLAEGLVAQGDLLAQTGRCIDADAAYHEAYSRFRKLHANPFKAEAALVCLYAASPPALLTMHGHGDFVESVAISPDSRTALSGSSDHTLKLWDLTTGGEIRTFTGHTSVVSSVAISSNGYTALSGSWDNTLKLWDLATGKELHTFQGHTKSVTSVAISPDGRTALSGSNDNTLKLWDLTTGKEIRTFEGHTDAVTSVAISSDGRTALSGSHDKTLKLWDLTTGREIRTFKGHTYYVFSVAISPDGRTGLSGGETLKLWDLATGREIHTLTGHSGSILSVAFSPDGRTAISGSADTTLMLWDVSAGKAIATLEGHAGSVNFVNSVAISHDGRVALSGGRDKTLKLWDLAIGKEVRTLQGHTDTVWGVALSPDGRTALSGSEDHTLKLWDLASGREIRTFRGHTKLVDMVEFGLDGRTASSGSDDRTSKEWDLASGREISTTSGHIPFSKRMLAFSPDGHTALAGGTNTLTLNELPTLKEIRSFTGHTMPITCVTFGPDCLTALSGSMDNTIKLWEVSTGKEIHTLRGHRGYITGVTISPDGHTGVSTSFDATLKLWDLSNGKEIRTLLGHAGSVNCCAISAVGLSVLSGSNDQRLKFWDFGRAETYNAYEVSVPTAQDVLHNNPDNAKALAVVGGWYAFRQMNDWAIELLERARVGGAPVDPLVLARCYWELSDDRLTAATTPTRGTCLAAAAREYTAAIASCKDEQEKFYLQLCLAAVQHSTSQAAEISQ